MTTAIVSRLKTGTQPRVVPYGFALPSAPYVVVKPESGPGETRMFRIIPHFLQGQNIFLEDYVFDELTTLLSNWEAVDRNGNRATIEPTDEYSDIIENDDSTISMERVFLIPQKLY